MPNILLAVLCVFLTAGTAVAESSLCTKRANAQYEIVEEKALAQFLIQGLTAFDTSTAEQTTAYFAKAPRHHMAIDHGETHPTTGARQWVQLVRNFTQSELNLLLAGTFRTAQTGGPTEQKLFPESQDDARDFDWLLKAGEVDRGASFDPDRADASLRIVAGELATCSLIVDTEFQNVCRVRNLLGPEKFFRAASESMVVRAEVEKNVEGAELLEIKRGGQCTSLSVPMIELEDCSTTNQSGCARWGNKYYKYVFDVRIRNSPPPRLLRPNHTQRAMRSFHGRHLKNLFQNSMASWDVVSTDCFHNGRHWECPNCRGFQPHCWAYFDEYRETRSTTDPVTEPSYQNVSACPLVGYP